MHSQVPRTGVAVLQGSEEVGLHVEGRAPVRTRTPLRAESGRVPTSGGGGLGP